MLAVWGWHRSLVSCCCVKLEWGASPQPRIGLLIYPNPGFPSLHSECNETIALFSGTRLRFLSCANRFVGQSGAYRPTGTAMLSSPGPLLTSFFFLWEVSNRQKSTRMTGTPRPICSDVKGAQGLRNSQFVYLPPHGAVPTDWTARARPMKRQLHRHNSLLEV